MSKILIVGAGQAGLQLGLGLLPAGHEVTVVSNRTPEDIRDGKVMSSECMFDAALQHERELGLDFWELDCPPVEGISRTPASSQQNPANTCNRHSQSKPTADECG